LQRQTANAPSFTHDGVALNDGTRSARRAGLRWVDPGEPGIARMSQGAAFAHRTAAGRVLRDEAALARIRKIAIPPAWQDVWVCADARAAPARSDSGACAARGLRTDEQRLLRLLGSLECQRA
jgi:DNA topoisomerase IB